jgi:hypothetical protein
MKIVTVADVGLRSFSTDLADLARPKYDPDYSYTLTCANSGVEQLHRLLADGEPVSARGLAQ